MTDWSERRKFWYESVRSLVIVLATAATAIWGVETWKAQQAEKAARDDRDYKARYDAKSRRDNFKAEVDKTRVALKAKVVGDFLEASYRYTAVASICKRGPAAKKHPEWPLYTGEYFDRYQNSRNALGVHFASDLEELESNLNELETLTTSLGDSCLSDEARHDELNDSRRWKLRERSNALALKALRHIGMGSTLGQPESE